MKDISKNICAFLLSVGMLTGCDLSLDLQPISEIGEGSFYQTDSDFTTAMVAAYNGMQAPLTNEWALTELRSDNSRVHNSQTSSNIYIPLRELDLMTFTSEHLYIYNYWADTYQNISRVNTILDKLDNVESPELQEQLLAESKFIRAYHYFNLVRLFGEAFLVDTRISAQDAKEMTVSSSDELYEFIISDLNAAASMLPPSYGPEYAGRATSWAAKALLAKVYRTQKKFAEAAPILKDIIDNSPARLLVGENGYASVFSTSNELNAEIIFAVRFKSGGLGIGGPFANYFAPQNSGSYVINGDGDHFNRPSDDLISQFSENDLRLNTTFLPGYNGAGGAFVPDPYVSKFFYDVSISDDAENDIPIIRFADILLMYAEALNETGNTSLGLDYLNTVRMRAGLDGYDISEVDSKQAFTEKLLLERRLEFAFENQRWFDLVLYNMVEETLNTQYETEVFYSEYTFGISPVQSDKLLLPLPQREVDIFNQGN